MNVKPPEGCKAVLIIVDETDWALFKSKCAEQGHSMREVIGEFIKDYVDEEY